MDNIEKKQPILIVYHCYLTKKWKELITQQLDRLINSKLYDEADNIYVTINLGDVEIEDVISFFKRYEKLNLEFFKDNHGEYPGILKVKQLSKEFDAKILYFHTKGVSNNWTTFNGGEISDIKSKNSNYWREFMEYFLIDNWRECVSKLDYYDNVGASLNGKEFWGNFWWTKTSHINKTCDVGIWSRWDYESWINKDCPESLSYQFYHLGFNPYLTELIPKLYNGEYDKFKGCRIIIKSATYGTPPFEIDEGYSTTPLNVVNDVTEIVTKLLDTHNGFKLSFNVNNETMGGDPKWGSRKCLIIKFSPEGFNDEIIEMGVCEGHNIEFKF